MKHLLSIFALTISSTALASFNPPAQCQYGRFDSDIKIEVPHYIAIDMPTRVKGDFVFDPVDQTKSVGFYTSFGSFVGYDETDTWDNAYKDIVLPSAAFGNQTIWVTNETDPLALFPCSKKDVVVHEIPTVSINSITGGNSLSISVSASISNISLRGSMGQSPLLTYTFRNMDYNNRTETFQTTNQNLTYSPTYRGDQLVTVSVSDGTFGFQTSSGIVIYDGGITPPPGGGTLR